MTQKVAVCRFVQLRCFLLHLSFHDAFLGGIKRPINGLSNIRSSPNVARNAA
jgi:hypothetical protein